MKIIELSIKRPVTTAMFYASIVLVGLIALVVLPRELFPTVTFPELLVVTRYAAAAPEEIENIITKVIEEQAGTVPDLKGVRSISREGVSIVILKFNWGTDMGLAHLAVREKIDAIKDRLPSEAEEPIVQRHNPFSQPMMILSISGDLPLHELTRLSMDVIKKRLQKVDGVASAVVSGGQEREITVDVDLDKMESSRVSITGIVDALQTSNINYPAGTTQGRFYEYLVRTVGEFKEVDEIGRTVVAVDAPREDSNFQQRTYHQEKDRSSSQPRMQRMLALENIAEIQDTFKEIESYSRYNGSSNVSVSIQRQFNANSIQTVRRVMRALDELRLSLPEAMKVNVIYKESKFIQNSLRDVATSGILGGLLAFLVLLYFLRKLQDALTVTLALPISFLIFFAFLYFTGGTINVIALAGLSLAIGSITDNAICVLDNIDKYRKRARNLQEASAVGASEVAIAQLASMLTNVAVFLPLLFAKGLAQQLFKDLFYAAVITNIAALVIALTLVPRIAAYPLWKSKSEDEKESIPAEEDVTLGVGGKIGSAAEGEMSHLDEEEMDFGPAVSSSSWKWSALLKGMTEDNYQRLLHFYRDMLEKALQNRRKVLGLVGGLFVFGISIFIFIPKVFLPAIDQGQFLIRMNMRVGTRIEVTNQVMKKIENVLLEMDGVKDVLARVGSGAEESIEALGGHQGECLVSLDPDSGLYKTTEEAILKLKKSLEEVNLEGAELEYLLQDSSMKAVTGSVAPISITIQGNDMNHLRNMSDEIQNVLRGIKGIDGVKSSMALPSFENRVSIDKDRASAFGLSVSDIAHASMIGIRGFIATYFKEEGKEIGVRVRLRAEDRNNSEAIRRVAIRARKGFMVPLGDVAAITSGYGPSEIERIDQQRAITVSAQIFGRSSGEVIEEVDQALTPFRKIKDYTVSLGGTKQEIKESFGGLVIAFLLSVILIYMIMAAGFESFLHPFLIMVTVPLGIIGVAFILLVTFTPLSTPAILGTVLLGGIVVNNGIVMISHINDLRKVHGKRLREAVVLGSTNRLRPVLMTALVNLLALTPIAMALGEGTEMSSPMALATIGGLTISTVLTLIVLPILYLMVEERKEPQQMSLTDETD